jgi:hypothetical protein
MLYQGWIFTVTIKAIALVRHHMLCCREPLTILFSIINFGKSCKIAIENHEISTLSRQSFNPQGIRVGSVTRGIWKSQNLMRWPLERSQGVSTSWWYHWKGHKEWVLHDGTISFMDVFFGKYIFLKMPPVLELIEWRVKIVTSWAPLWPRTCSSIRKWSPTIYWWQLF